MSQCITPAGPAVDLTKQTRTLSLIECEVTDEAGRLVAKGFSTCMVLRGQEAHAR